MSAVVCEQLWPGQLVLPPDPASVRVTIGGKTVTVAGAKFAADLLSRSPGLMIRQPLARISHPLAWCDYHAEAAPYRADYYGRLTFTGRGAAGRQVAKQAFIKAIGVRCEEAMRLAPYAAARVLIEQAYTAFGSDPSYYMEMARSAVATMERQHAWKLRQDLKSAQDRARAKCKQAAGQFTCRNESPCGTGACRFAEGVLRSVTVAAKEGRVPRPANHVPGTPYSAEPALAQLEQLVPFRVTVA